MVAKMAAIIILKRGILLLKRHSYVSYNQCRVFEMSISRCSHNSDVIWFQLGLHII